MAEFPKLQEYLNKPYAYHAIDKVVCDAAGRLLDYFKNNPEFGKFNHSGNSEPDVRSMFNDMTDQWISDNYLNIASDDDSAIEKYNILTDVEINSAMKDDVFANLWKKSNKECQLFECPRIDCNDYSECRLCNYYKENKI